MSELAVTLLRLSYLALLWVFVFAAISALRRDLYAVTRVTNRGRRQRPAAAPAPSAATPAAAPLAPPPTPAGPPPSAPRAPSAGGPVRQSLSRPPTRLVVTAGKMAGTSLPLGRSGIVVGRSPSCTLVLDDSYASSRHARFFPQGDTWFVEDLGSTNGTLVAGRPVEQPVALATGTEVRIGETALELRR